MDATLKKAVERAITPAYETVQRAIESGNSKWHVGDDTFAREMDDLSPARRKNLVAYEAMGIVQLRRRRTLSSDELTDAMAYAESLVK